MQIKEQVIKKSALTPTVLIAGGAGFIGSHLAETLLKKGARVIVIDNLTTGKDIYVNSLLNNPKFALFNADINKEIPGKIESVDYIVHLAGVESYIYSEKATTLDSLLTNAVGTKNLLDLAHKSAAKFLLVSSIDVYQGLISPVDLDHYFGQTQEEETKYSLSEAKRFAEALVWEFYKFHETDVRIARLPEVFGPRMNLTSSGNLGRLMKDLVEHRNLAIYGEGTEKENYLYISDAVSGLVRSLFEKETEGKIFTFVPKEPHAVLETTYILKGLANKDVQIEFKPRVAGKTAETKVPASSTTDQIGWGPKTEYKDGIKKTLEWLRYDINEHSFKPNKLIEMKQQEGLKKSGNFISSLIDTEERVEEEPIVEKNKVIKFSDSDSQRKKPKFKLPKLKLGLPEFDFPESPITPIALAIITAVLIIFFLPFVETGIYTASSLKNLQKIPEQIAQMDVQGAKASANSAYRSGAKANKALYRTNWMFAVIGKQKEFDSMSNLLESEKYFAKSMEGLVSGAEPFTYIWETLKPNSDGSLHQNDFMQAKAHFIEAENNLQLALAEYKNVDQAYLSDWAQGKLEMYDFALNSLEENIGLLKELADETPSLLGSNGGTKRYLILFQNPTEIRPTGGFIGSYASLEVKDGKIENLIIDDIYNPDGQLDVKEISTTPPNPIKVYLEEEKLHIRNANWDPDFLNSSATIADLYTKATGNKVDGIFAVDLYFVQDLLNVTGPIFLTAYNEEITSENLYERAQLHSEFNYTDGSNQKKSFLTLLGSKLLEKIFALENKNLEDLVITTYNALEERNMMMNFFNSTVTVGLTEKGWTGSLVETDSDYLYVVNSNLGGTKANYYIANAMDYTVSSKTRDGLLRAQLELSYNHTGTDNSWPGGPYKDYVRVLTQNGSKLTGAEVKFKDGKTEDIFETIIIDKVGDYTSFETFFELQPQQNVTLTFYYDLPQSLSITENVKDYELYWQKQPGTDGDSINFTLEQPFGMQVTSGNPTFRETFVTDKEVFISLN